MKNFATAVGSREVHPDVMVLYSKVSQIVDLSELVCQTYSASFYPCTFCSEQSGFLQVSSTWRSGDCYLNKGECNLNQSKDDSFVERVAKNNS